MPEPADELHRLLAERLAALGVRLDPSQRGRMLRLSCALPDLALLPERMALRETLGRPYELVIDCLSPDRHFELKRLIGEQVTLELLQPDGRHAPWHGYAFEAAQLGADGGLARWRLVVRPWLSFLALRTDCFAYHDKTAVEIAQEVFADHPQANAAFDVREPLRRRSLCIQYNESDLDFVLRLFAEEGLALRFEQLEGDAAADADRAAKARHRLVVVDRDAARESLGELRFAAQHPTANLDGQRDAVTAFEACRRIGVNAVALGSWDYKALAGAAATTQTALAIGELPPIEAYDGSGAYRFESAEHAERAATLARQAEELGYKTYSGLGGVRAMAVGRTFRLIDHPLYGANATAASYAGALSASHERPDNEFVLLAVEHHATNNLGAQVAELLGATELERGTYRNRFEAAPAAAPTVPRFVRKPTAPGLQTAVVVGLADEALTTDRDLRVRVQFPWQRGESPLAGGLGHDEGSPDRVGHAPGDARSLTWVRLAWPSAGANWGSAFVPRAGTEVAVAFVEGDIDRPVIVGQLHHGDGRPPFAAGVDSGVNHAGAISGWHSPGLDGAGFNQWVIDDSTGQLRMRLMSGYATSHLDLGHLIQQGASGAQRGAWRGSGFELATAGWASVRAGQGLFVSTTARVGTYASAASTQMDAGEAAAQLRASRELGAKLGQAAQASHALGLRSHDAGEALDRVLEAIDPARLGRQPEVVGGQRAVKPAADGRTPGDEPVEAFARPLLVLDTPSAAVWTSEASVLSMAGRDTSLTAQSDLQQTAGATHASVAGGTASLFTHAGGAKVVAASGPVSVRAHTDALALWADREVTIVSVGDEIRIQAKSRIELTGGRARLALDGGNVDFECAGKFEVRSATHDFLGGGSNAASLTALPVGTADRPPREIELHYHYDDLTPVVGADYKVVFDDGTVREGKLDADGYARLTGVPAGTYTVEYGEDARAWKPAAQPEPDPDFKKPDVQSAGRAAIEAMLRREPAAQVDASEDAA